MTVNKRAKNSRHRGSKTHGWGDKKKHRGSGHRGGTGNAGSGKKADCKKPRFWKDPYYFGKFGFVHQGVKTTRVVTLQYLETCLPTLLAQHLVEGKDDAYVVDVGKLGYDKVLSKGLVTRKWHLTAKHISSGAKQKIEDAGGIVVNG